MRTQQEIERQIKGLEKEKQTLPEFNFFGDPNHLAIDYQIKTLKGEITLEQYNEDGCDDEYYDRIAASIADAEDWLNEYNLDDLFSEDD